MNQNGTLKRILKHGKAALLFCFLFFASAAYGLEWETLVEQGFWRLDVNMYGDGDTICEARSSSESDVIMSFEEWKDGASTIAFHNSAWKFPEEPISTKFIMAVDQRAPWHMSGSRAKSTIMLTTDDANKKKSFLRDIRNGRVLILYNDESIKIGQFSLSGSSYIFDALSECRKR